MRLGGCLSPRLVLNNQRNTGREKATWRIWVICFPGPFPSNFPCANTQYCLFLHGIHPEICVPTSQKGKQRSVGRVAFISYLSLQMSLEGPSVFAEQPTLCPRCLKKSVNNSTDRVPSFTHSSRTDLGRYLCHVLFCKTEETSSTVA